MNGWRVGLKNVSVFQSRVSQSARNKLVDASHVVRYFRSPDSFQSGWSRALPSEQLVSIKNKAKDRRRQNRA